jgi:hypothetical protein
MDHRKAGFWSLFFLAMLLACIAQAVHEGGHWAVYQAYGRGPVWGFIALVQRDTLPSHPNEWQEITDADGGQSWLRLASLPNGATEKLLANAAGPLASLLGVVLGLLITRLGRNPVTKKISLAFALNSAITETLYYLRSPLRSGGDEFGAAMQLGIPKYGVEIPFALAFLFCLILGLRELAGWRTQLKWMAAILLGSVATGLILNLADAVVRAQVDAGNSLFLPVFGFSFPVFAVNSLAFLIVVLWWTWQKEQVPDLLKDKELA